MKTALQASDIADGGGELAKSRFLQEPFGKISQGSITVSLLDTAESPCWFVGKAVEIVLDSFTRCLRLLHIRFTTSISNIWYYV